MIFTKVPFSVLSIPIKPSSTNSFLLLCTFFNHISLDYWQCCFLYRPRSCEKTTEFFPTAINYKESLECRPPQITIHSLIRRHAIAHPSDAHFWLYWTHTHRSGQHTAHSAAAQAESARAQTHILTSHTGWETKTRFSALMQTETEKCSVLWQNPNPDLCLHTHKGNVKWNVGQTSKAKLVGEWDSEGCMCRAIHPLCRTDIFWWYIPSITTTSL